MENFTVKELGAVEQKSMQEIEQNLLNQHEENQHHEEVVVPEVVITPEEVVTPEYGDSDVLSYIKNRYN